MEADGMRHVGRRWVFLVGAFACGGGGPGETAGDDAGADASTPDDAVDEVVASAPGRLVDLVNPFIGAGGRGGVSGAPSWAPRPA